MYRSVITRILFCISLSTTLICVGGPARASAEDAIHQVVYVQSVVTTIHNHYDAIDEQTKEQVERTKEYERKAQWSMVSRGEFTREGKIPPVLLQQFPKARSIGKANVTFFTTHDPGCDAYGAWGDRIIPYKSVAIDPRYYKHGTKFYVEGYGIMIAHDTGGKIKKNHMDIAVPTKQEALQRGRIHPKVWVLQ